jgi:hypothetical protein
LRGQPVARRLGYRGPHSANLQDRVHGRRLGIPFAALGYRLCRTAEEINAWSQNLGHAHPLTTFANYGPIASPQQGEIMRTIGVATPDAAFQADVRELLDKLRRRG